MKASAFLAGVIVGVAGAVITVAAVCVVREMSRWVPGPRRTRDVSRAV
jgi:hypothetical protein